jgi:hypothetical protein
MTNAGAVWLPVSGIVLGASGKVSKFIEIVMIQTPYIAYI